MYKKLAVVTIFVATLSRTIAAAPTPEKVCRSSTWVNCGTAVQDALKKMPQPPDPKAVLSLALAWGQAYDQQYEALRSKGKLQKSTPDADKIFDEVKSHLDPVEVAKDKAIDALLKKYLPRVAAVLEWAEKPVAVALKAFFDSSEIATDYDELRLMNDSIQKRVGTLLEPFMVSDWKTKFEKAVSEAAPQLKLP
jgi:hypothetical protein